MNIIETRKLPGMAKSKVIRFSELDFKQKIKEVEELIRFALIEGKIISPDYTLCPEADNFADLGADEGTIFIMLQLIEKEYLGFFGIVNIIPSDNETIAHYAERLALDL